MTKKKEPDVDMAEYRKTYDKAFDRAFNVIGTCHYCGEPVRESDAKFFGLMIYHKTPCFNEFIIKEKLEKTVSYGD